MCFCSLTLAVEGKHNGHSASLSYRNAKERWRPHNYRKSERWRQTLHQSRCLLLPLSFHTGPEKFSFTRVRRPKIEQLNKKDGTDFLVRIEEAEKSCKHNWMCWEWQTDPHLHSRCTPSCYLVSFFTSGDLVLMKSIDFSLFLLSCGLIFAFLLYLLFNFEAVFISLPVCFPQCFFLFRSPQRITKKAVLLSLIISHPVKLFYLWNSRNCSNLSSAKHNFSVFCTFSCFAPWIPACPWILTSLTSSHVCLTASKN